MLNVEVTRKLADAPMMSWLLDQCLQRASSEALSTSSFSQAKGFMSTSTLEVDFQRTLSNIALPDMDNATVGEITQGQPLFCMRFVRAMGERLCKRMPNLTCSPQSVAANFGIHPVDRERDLAPQQAAMPQEVPDGGGCDGEEDEGNDPSAPNDCLAYTVPVILRFIQMSYTMKEAGSLKEIVRMAAGFALPPDEYEDFCTRFQDGSMHLPKQILIYKLRIFAAACDKSDAHWFRHLSGDSSTQKPFEYLNTVEERFVLTGSPAAIAQKWGEDFAAGKYDQFGIWKRRTLPVTVLGTGCMSVYHKFSRVVNVLALETGSDLMQQRRVTVATWLGDQGADLGVGEGPDYIGDLPSFIGDLQNDRFDWASEVAQRSFFSPTA